MISGYFCMAGFIFLFSLEASTFVKIHKKLGTDELNETFVHNAAWFNICDFAYIPQGDPHVPSVIDIESAVPENVPLGGIIFTTYIGMRDFFEKVHPKITNPYILLTAYYGPCSSDAQYINDQKIIAWFGTVDHRTILYDKFTPVPLGVYRLDDIFLRRVHYNNFFKKLSRVNKKNILYLNFTIHQNRGPETDYRQFVYDVFKHSPLCKLGGKKPFDGYMRDMAECLFTVSPDGDMYDCYRHWEALLVGSIPIIQSSPLNTLFEGLPVIIVDDYNQVNEKFLEEKLNELYQKNNFKFQKLYMKYWVDKINAVRVKYHS